MQRQIYYGLNVLILLIFVLVVDIVVEVHLGNQALILLVIVNFLALLIQLVVFVDVAQDVVIGLCDLFLYVSLKSFFVSKILDQLGHKAFADFILIILDLVKGAVLGHLDFMVQLQ